jgi:hypothetical protein
MKIKNGAWSGSLRTALGSLTFHTEANGVIVVRKKPIPTQPRTEKQLLVRESFRTVLELWRSLDVGKILLWRDAFYRFQNVFKDYLNDTSGKVLPDLLVVPFSEKDLFMSLNLRAEIYNRYGARFSLRDVPPPLWIALPFVAQIVQVGTLDGSGSVLISWRVEGKGWIGVYHKWRYKKELFAVVESEIGEIDITDFLKRQLFGNHWFQLLFVEEDSLTYSLSNLLLYRKI